MPRPAFDSRLTDPSCTSVVFSTFNCDSFDNGERYLKADYSIDCDSPTHRDYQRFAGVMMVWPLGVPVVYLCVFFIYHTRIRASSHYAPVQQARRRSSAWAPPGARGPSLEPAAVSATADGELAAATGTLGQEGGQEQQPDLLTAMVTGDVGEKQEVKGLPASVVALISLCADRGSNAGPSHMPAPAA